ncbi:sensor histidine kinase [Gulosibacter bifidus]|uniref:histidine kinase n=1 Tax=Gulosibacter bifidus TaxID=272239 RepID=A0ABW5RKC0_9MICO|nr:histidine kinase [Gulosibacter bifidus]
MQDSFIATRPNPMRVLRNDAIAAGIMGALSALPLLLPGGNVAPQLVGYAVLWSVLSCLVLTARRVAPVTTLLATSVLAGATQGQTPFALLPTFLAVLIAAYGVAAFAQRKYMFLSFLPMAAALVQVALQIFIGMPWASDHAFLGVDAWRQAESLIAFVAVVVLSFLTSWALGMVRRSQLAEVVTAQEKALLLERDQQRLTELALSDERSRISREMHDIIAHSLASIVTLAEGGRMASRTRPEIGSELFGKISEAARDALGDIKVLLQRVDSPQDDAPVKGIGDLRELVSAAQLADVPLRFIETGEPRELPKGLSLAVFRVGQECLTNMYKHAPGAPGELHLDWRSDQLVLRAINERVTSAPPVPSDKRGLSGMRERTELFNGEFSVHENDTSFEISAIWPFSAT